jgi:hypothetical protein
MIRQIALVDKPKRGTATCHFHFLQGAIQEMQDLQFRLKTVIYQESYPILARLVKAVVVHSLFVRIY